MQDIGVVRVLVAAMNQAFFTLSIGIGAMAIFGSYIGKERSLLEEASHVAVLDTAVAIDLGLIILPACFAYGVEPGSGQGLQIRPWMRTYMTYVLPLIVLVILIVGLFNFV